MLKKIMQAKKDAMLQKDDVAKGILSILHSSVNAIAKEDGGREITDSDIIVSVKKLIKQNGQTRDQMKNGSEDAYKVLDKELHILNEFLPVQMTEDEVKQFIDLIIAGIAPEDRVRKNQGKVMVQLKPNAEVMDMTFAAKYVSSKFS